MCLITVLPSLRPGPEPRPVRRRRERMNSLTDLRDVVGVVIGVDTHVHTHSAAALDTATGGVLNEITIDATPEGYAELVDFANNHPMLWAWAIKGTGSHGRRSEPVSVGDVGHRHRVGPPQAGCTPQRREVRPARRDPRRT